MSGPTVAAIATAAAYGALAGAALGGISAAIQGGDIGMGILGGGLGGAVTGGLGAWASPVIGSVAGGAISGAMGGVVNSAITGGNPLSGALSGGVMGGVFGAMNPSSNASGGYGATMDAPQSLATGVSDGTANAFGNSPMDMGTIPMGAEFQQGPMLDGATLDTVMAPNYSGAGLPSSTIGDIAPLAGPMTPGSELPMTVDPQVQQALEAIQTNNVTALQNMDPAAVAQAQAIIGNPTAPGLGMSPEAVLNSPTYAGQGKSLGFQTQLNNGGSQGYIDSMNIPNDPLNPAQRLQVTANNKLGDIGMGPATATTQLTGYNPQTAYGLQPTKGAMPYWDANTNSWIQPSQLTQASGGIPGATAAAAPWGTTGIGPVDTGLNWIQNNKLLAAGGGLTLFSALGGNSNQAPAAANPTGTMNPSFNKPLQQYGYLQPGGAVTQYRQVAARPTWVPQTQTWGYNAQGQMVPVTSNGSGGLQQMKAGGAVHGGQDDRIPILGAAGEYMVPADVVSGLGDGYSDAGAKKLDQLVANVRQHKGAPKKLPKRSKPTAAGYLRSA